MNDIFGSYLYVNEIYKYDIDDIIKERSVDIEEKGIKDCFEFLEWV